VLTPLPDMGVRAVDGDPSQTSMTVITLLWRNERYADAFLRTLETAAAAADTSVELVAVENGPDGTLTGLALARAAADAEHIRMLLCRSPENAGFSGGSNRGCAVASGDILVVANLDLEFDPAFVVEVKARAAALSEPAFLVPSVASSRMNGQGVDGGPLRRDWLNRPAVLAETPSPGERVPSANGSCIIFGRSLYARRCAAVGGVFDPEYHSYYEDLDLFWWAERQDIPALWAPNIKVLHHQGGSFGGKYSFRDRPADLRASVMANYRLTVWRHASRLPEVFGWLMGEAGYLAKCVLYAGPSGVGDYLRSWHLSRIRVRAIVARRGAWR
jgi:GT2 family glycosyltransferase